MSSSAASPVANNRAPIEILISPFARFAKMEAAGGILLLLATVIALVWANSPWAESYHGIWHTTFTLGIGRNVLSWSRHVWVNDGLMAIFFFLVGLEIKREVLIGELASLRQAAFPFMAALGGSIVPALLYLALNHGDIHARGWGIPMATDIAFALGVLALLGSRVPASLKVFVAALAIVDDIFGVLVIALFYTAHISYVSLALGFLGVGVSFLANWAGIRNPAVYAFIGIIVWFAVLQSGVHATIAGVLLAFTIPVKSSIEKESFLKKSRRLLDRFEQAELNSVEAHAAIHTLESQCEKMETPLHRIEHSLPAMGKLPDHAGLCIFECRGAHSGPARSGGAASGDARSYAGTPVRQAAGDHELFLASAQNRAWVGAGRCRVETDFRSKLAVRHWVHDVAVHRRAGA